jgi:hypothetical protein
MRKALLSVALALTLAACAALPAPVVRPTGRPEPSLSKTAKPRTSRTRRPTKTSEPTETRTASPSVTPEPALSLTPTVLLPFVILPQQSLTPTPTLLIASPATTPAPPSGLDCKLIWQSPPNGATFDAGQNFSVGWNIRNIGTATWEAGSFEFTYLGGARLYPGYLVPLKTSVAPGETVVLSLPIKAPRNSNNYTTHWGIRQGHTFFCRLTLTIWVP